MNCVVNTLKPLCWKIKKRSKREGISKGLIVVQLYDCLLLGGPSRNSNDPNCKSYQNHRDSEWEYNCLLKSHFPINHL